MMEGREKCMELSDVDETTMLAFLEWAYVKDYTVLVAHPYLSRVCDGDINWLTPVKLPITRPNPSSVSAVLHHTTIYTFAERFNIPMLKDLAYSRTIALLAGKPQENDVTHIMAAVMHAFDNLPLSTSSGAIERLLRYFIDYIDWALDIFRPTDDFRSCLKRCPDFLEVFVMNTAPNMVPPWAKLPITMRPSKPGSASISADPSPSLTLNYGKKSHILSRKCRYCGWQGIMSITCASCKGRDSEIGTVVCFYSTRLGSIGDDRVKGTSTRFQHKCNWCSESNLYSVDTYAPGGTKASGFFNCRKCGKDCGILLPVG